MIHVGCSGWVYRHWRGLFYPKGLPQKRWFERYAEEFDTVEINASFYRVAARHHVRRLARQGAGRLPLRGEGESLHHPHEEAARLRGRGRSLHRSGAAARGQRSGPCSISCRRASTKNLERLEAFLAALPRDLEHVVEFRHKSWYDEDVLALLDRYGVGFVAHDLQGPRSRRAGRAAAPLTSASTARAANIGAAISDEALLDWTDWCVEQVAQRPKRLVLFQQRHPRPRDRGRADAEVDGQADETG